MSPTEKRNIKRILLFFIYPLVFLLKIIPRDKNIWIFGNFKGYIDNTKYIYEFVNHKNSHLKVFWLTRDIRLYNFLKSEGKNVLYYYSFLGIWKSFRAGVSFISNGYSDLNKLALINSFNVNLWHGFPIKKIVFDAELETTFYSFGKFNKILTYLSTVSLQFLNNKIDLYLVSSNLELERMSNAFRVSKDKFRLTGTPRLDIVGNKKTNNLEIYNIFYHYNTTNGKNIMYAPSWREKGWHPRQTIINPQKLINYLESENSYLFIKRHPLTTKEEIENWGIRECKRIHFIDNFDINEAYQFVDILITDFSSLIFDFGILNKPILFFITDLDQYSNNRGFYDNIVKISNNAINQNWTELIDALKRLEHDSFHINHPHFNSLLKHSHSNVRKGIVELVQKEIRNVKN
jgi:CDP-glycerol glycerophosphotransferase